MLLVLTLINAPWNCIEKMDKVEDVANMETIFAFLFMFFVWFWQFLLPEWKIVMKTLESKKSNSRIEITNKIVKDMFEGSVAPRVAYIPPVSVSWF